MGFMTRDEAGQGKKLTLFSVWNYVFFMCCVKPCIAMLENARSVILQEMTNYLLSMNPVKTSKKGCRLKQFRE